MYKNESVKMHQKSDLVQMQSLPLDAKIIMTKQRIKVWYESWCKFKITNTKTGKTRFVVFDTRGDKEPPLKNNEYSEYVDDGQVYVSFSGGKDSTVLLHLVRQMYPDVEAVFVNTGLEYPEIQRFVKTFDNITILKPAMRFDEVIKTYGYPMISKDVSHKIQYAQKGVEWAKKYVEGTATMQSGEKSLYCIEKYKPLLDVDFRISSECCEIMKKKPLKEYTKQTQKKPLTAQMASESRRRLAHWLHRGCNAFDAKNPMSNPMSFWTEQDVLNSIYGDEFIKY